MNLVADPLKAEALRQQRHEPPGKPVVEIGRRQRREARGGAAQAEREHGESLFHNASANA